MATYFLDSSALAKCYITESGSDWIRGITGPASHNDLHVLQIVELEVVSAIARRRKGGTITAPEAVTAIAQVRYDLRHDYVVMKVSDRLVSEAIALADHHELRAYDALHLAAAIELNRLRAAAGQPTATIVSADLELNAAAVANGFQVEDPNTQP